MLRAGALRHSTIFWPLGARRSSSIAETEIDGGHSGEFLTAKDGASDPSIICLAPLPLGRPCRLAIPAPHFGPVGESELG